MSAAASDSWRRRRSQAERLADAESARIDADTARREAQLERDRAERERQRADALRVAAESTAYKALQERDEAIAKAAELEATLTQAAEEPPAAPEPTPATEPTPTAAPTSDVPPQAAPSPEPEPPLAADRPDVTFAAPVKGATLTVLLSVAALGGAGIAVYLAYLDRLSSVPGVVTAVVTVALAVSINRTGRSTTSVAIRRGVVIIDAREGSGRFDLSSTATLVEMVGRPGDSGWKVVFLRKTRPPVAVDRSMVDPHEFVAELRHWRPSL